MKVLITGGSGFIGLQTALEARARGLEIAVAGLCNSADEAQRIVELESAGMPMRQGSVLDPEFVRTLVRGCDAVIHLAAAQHEANRPDSYFRKVNVDGTRLLLEACCRAGVKRFVYGSTIGVYGSAANRAIDETTAPRPDNIYTRTKLEAEQVVRSFAEKIEVVIIRISETYGPGDLRLLKLFKAVDRGLFFMIGRGTNLRQPIHVYDLVRGLLLAVEHPAAIGQTFVFAGPQRMTTRSMLEEIAAALNRSLRMASAPLGLFSVAAAVVEKICKPLGIQPPLHRRRLDFFTKSFCFSTHKAAALLGFNSTIPFAKGAQDTVSWYRNRAWLRGSSARGERHAPASPVLQSEADVPLRMSEGAHYLRYQDILEYTHDAIIIWEMDGAGILYWNRAAERLYGFDRRDALGQVTHVLLKTRLEEGIDRLEQKLTRYGVWAGVLRHQRSDGAPVVVETRLALMSQRNGKWLVLEINKDITPQPDRRGMLTSRRGGFGEYR